MVKIDDWLANTALALVDSHALFAFAIWQPVQTKQVSVIGLHDVFFGFIAIQRADIGKIRRFRNLRGKVILVRAIFWLLGCEKCVE